MSRKSDLMEYAQRMLPGGFHLTEYNPGDGQTRYRIVYGDNHYFGGREVCTALGLKEAEVMVRAFIKGLHYKDLIGTAATPAVGEGPLSAYEVDFDQQAVTRWRVEFKAPASLTDEEAEAIGEAIYYGGAPKDMPEKLAAIVNALLEQGAAPYEKDTEGFETEPVGVSRW